MQPIRKYFFLSLSITLLLLSCSIQKRQHLPGYHIEWKEWRKTSRVSNDFNHNQGNLIEKEVNIIINKDSSVKETYLVFESSDSINSPATSNSISSKDDTLLPFSSYKTNIKKNENFHLTKQLSTHAFLESNKNDPAANLKSDEPVKKGKSQLTALLLCIFIGGLGIHRFYLGYTGIGIIQLLTLGGCGIWTLIDLIMIITGDLKPKDGEYEEKI